MPSKIYPVEVAAAISKARAERMALLCHLAENVYDYKSWQRKNELDKELFELTGAEIYRPLGHHKPRYDSQWPKRLEG